MKCLYVLLFTLVTLMYPFVSNAETYIGRVFCEPEEVCVLFTATGTGYAKINQIQFASPDDIHPNYNAVIFCGLDYSDVLKFQDLADYNNWQYVNYDNKICYGGLKITNVSSAVSLDLVVNYDDNYSTTTEEQQLDQFTYKDWIFTQGVIIFLLSFLSIGLVFSPLKRKYR